MIALYKKHEIELPKNVKFTIGSPVKKTYFEWLKNPIKKLIEVRRKNQEVEEEVSKYPATFDISSTLAI